MYFDKHLKELNEVVLVELVKSLFLRVEKELGRVLKKEIDNSLLLLKCLHVVKSLVSVKNFLIGKPFLEESIWEFYQFLNYLKQINFEDDIFEILNCVIRQKQRFTEK